jgi:poly-gamma-glutamate capsule biosynthesis protein CapA/YwtB (metallophosphatase superfamily)
MTMRIGLAGDVMLGRLVDRYVLADPSRDPAFVWGDTLSLWRGVDLRLVNLECVIATTGVPWIPKVFHFRAGPRAVDALAAAGIHAVSLANNHVLDFGVDALRECLSVLRNAGIRFAGAGETAEDASAPAVISAPGGSAAVVAVTDAEPQWEAGAERPGTFFVHGDEHGLMSPYRERLTAALVGAAESGAFVICSGHAGPNWGPPTDTMRALAHQAIDLGADLYWGHSNHTVQGIEIYRGRPILYSTGDFVDDYAVDPEERNDLSCFFEVVAEGRAVRRIVLHPVRIRGLHASIAPADDARWMRRWVMQRLADFGTEAVDAGDAVVVEAGGSRAGT